MYAEYVIRYCTKKIMLYFSFFLMLTIMLFQNGLGLNFDLALTAQKVKLCCNCGLRRYQELASSHFVTDYKHNISLLN